ncbi:MAG: ribosome-associated translation inhibitor RaiA [Bacteroidales bacterium]|nr:ribosome-associated translation inhibitor RaiA [Bacteroidales bacterium]
MEIKLNAIKFKIDKKLEGFIHEKLEKLNVYYDNILVSDVMLKVENNNTLENKIAEVKISVKGNDLYAKKQSKTFEEAIDSATEALKKQLTRYKEKTKKM